MPYGTINVDTITASTGVLATQNGITGIAKAWVNYQGGNGNTSGTINGSFNVSSVTANATGNWTVNYTTAMPNANYVVVGNALESVADGTLSTNRSINPSRTALLTTSVRIGCVFYDGTAQTVNSVFVAVFCS